MAPARSASCIRRRYFGHTTHQIVAASRDSGRNLLKSNARTEYVILGTPVAADAARRRRAERA
jgi:hypothetical protein